MADYVVNGESLTAVADAIREKTGSTDTMTLGEMPGAVRGIQGGGTQNAVLYVPQTLTDEQKEQARANIGAVSYNPHLPVEMIEGYYLISNGRAFAGAPYCCTDFIEVRAGDVVRLENVYFPYGSVVIALDGNKNVTRVLATNGTETLETLVVTVEDGEKYIRATGKSGVSITATLTNGTIEQRFQTLENRVSDAEHLTERIDDVTTSVERVVPGAELLTGASWWLGFYWNNGMKETGPANCSLYTGSCNPFSVKPGEDLTITYIVPSTYATEKWFALNLFNEAGGYVLRVADALTNYETVDGNAVFTAKYTVPDGVYSISASARSFAKGWTNPDASATDADVAILADMVFIESNGTLSGYLLPSATEAEEGDIVALRDGKWVAATGESVYANANVKAINHRGYNSVAPENTLSAYRLSKKKGFEYVECDVKFTADNVPVLLHDDTVDRTSNGTGNIADMTFADARALDFGGWKSAEYAGEKIPSFEEFIILCKRIGLHPYIHFEYPSLENTEKMVSIVKRCGMHKKVTWISFASASLSRIKNVDEYARLGLVRNVPNETEGENTISLVSSLKGENNEVFIDIGWSGVSDDFATQCAENDIPLEVWTLDHKPTLLALDTYVSGITSDTERANVTLYDEFG